MGLPRLTSTGTPRAIRLRVTSSSPHAGHKDNG
jgi:hypothetical protein